jgi:hypothetical protein
MEILLNNSQYLGVKKITSTNEAGYNETANVVVDILYSNEELMESITLSHIGGGEYRADIPIELPFVDNGVYILLTKINVDGLQGEWEEIVTAKVRRK